MITRDADMNDLGGHDIEDLEVGMQASFAKTISEADIVLFAAASGDNNAVHINEEFARATAFGGRIAHGMLSAGQAVVKVTRRIAGAAACAPLTRAALPSPASPVRSIAPSP